MKLHYVHEDDRAARKADRTIRTACGISLAPCKRGLGHYWSDSAGTERHVTSVLGATGCRACLSALAPQIAAHKQEVEARNAALRAQEDARRAKEAEEHRRRARVIWTALQQYVESTPEDLADREVARSLIAEYDALIASL